MSGRILPLIGFCAFVLFGIVLRVAMHAHATGKTGFALFRSGRRAQDARDALFVLLVFLLGLQALLAWLAPRALESFGLVAWLARPSFRAAGLCIVLASTAWIAVSQASMGRSWRVGIEEGARPGLVARGAFRCSRNPIYVGLFGSLAGLALLMPTVLSFALLAGTVFGVHRQVLEEERWLERTYGDEYLAYARRVGRYLPWLGRRA